MSSSVAGAPAGSEVSRLPKDSPQAEQVTRHGEDQEKKAQEGKPFQTDIPARMDRLPWSRFHWLVVASLGITWILDGLEVTIIGNISSVLTKKSTLDISTSQASFAGSMYILGAVIGALFFGYLTDKFGRKRLFMITLGVYLIGTAGTAFAWGYLPYLAFRVIVGLGIGGEYAAINSAIDELIPARVRGTIDLGINGSYWFGSIIASVVTVFTLNPAILPTAYGWRISFVAGVALAGVVLMIRRYVPESPRWLMTHGKLKQADAIVTGIENKVKQQTGEQNLPPPGPPITIKPRGSIGFITIAKTVFGTYPKRSFLGFSLFVGQAFLYNAVTFTQGLLLTTFFHVPASAVPYYLIAWAIGNLLGPLTIGRLFDTIGRKKMITGCYVLSGILLIITGFLFERGFFNAVTFTIALIVVFYFASAGASAAYLTVSEVFPLELRAMGIAFFYAIGTGVGGFFGPILFGSLIQSANPHQVFIGYVIGAILMIAAGIVEVIFGVNAEQKSLESVASPLSAVGGGDQAQKDYNKNGGQAADNRAGRDDDENAQQPKKEHQAAGTAPRQSFVLSSRGPGADGSPGMTIAPMPQDETKSIDVHIEMHGNLPAVQNITIELQPQEGEHEAQGRELEHGIGV